MASQSREGEAEPGGGRGRRREWEEMLPPYLSMASFSPRCLTAPRKPLPPPRPSSRLRGSFASARNVARDQAHAPLTPRMLHTHTHTHTHTRYLLLVLRVPFCTGKILKQLMELQASHSPFGTLVPPSVKWTCSTRRSAWRRRSPLTSFLM